MERVRKKEVVEELGAKLKQLDSMFIAEYSGMNMAQITRLRRELRNVGVEFNVVKNTLLKLASAGTKAETLQEEFHGPNAIVCIYSDYSDATSAARILQTFSKEIPHLKLKAGFLGNQNLTPDDILKLATLPSRDMLLGKFLGLLQAMPQRLLYVLTGTTSKLLYTLDAIKTQKAQA